MQNSRRNFRFYILSSRDVIGWFFAIIVNGYIVSISLIKEFNWWHGGVLLCGVVIGLICFFLLRLSKDFNDIIKRQEEIEKRAIIEKKENQIKYQDSEQKKDNSWEEIKNIKIMFNVSSEKFIVSMPLTILLFLIIGILFFIKGNQKIEEKIKRKEEMEERFMLHKIDSVIHHHSQNSIIIRNIDSLSRHIQVLEEQLKPLKEINRKK